MTDAIDSIDHDRLFKELISTFFLEFLELFLPDMRASIDPTSIRFLQQEYFADLTAGEDKIIDLLVEVKQLGEDAVFIFHLEAQASQKAHFARRIFFYFARLHQKFLLRIYPIVIFSFDKPYREEPHTYISRLSIDRIEALGEALLEFRTLVDLEAWLSQQN